MSARGIEALLENNRQWVERMTAQDPEYFRRLAREQRPEYLFIGCSDSRVPANTLTGTSPGGRGAAAPSRLVDVDCSAIGGSYLGAPDGATAPRPSAAGWRRNERSPPSTQSANLASPTRFMWSRSAMKSESRLEAIAVSGASLEAAIELVEPEVHPITTAGLS